MRLKGGEEHYNGVDSPSDGYVEVGKRGLGGDLETLWSLEGLVKG